MKGGEYSQLACEGGAENTVASKAVSPPRAWTVDVGGLWKSSRAVASAVVGLISVTLVISVCTSDWDLFPVYLSVLAIALAFLVMFSSWWFSSSSSAEIQHLEIATVTEEKGGGCALEHVAKLDDKELKTLRYLEMVCVVFWVGNTYVLAVCACSGAWFIFEYYIMILCIHAVIRSIMDYVYDTANLSGVDKWLRVAKLAFWNFSQMRVIFDAEACVVTRSLGMTINMTLMCEALLKNVPFVLVNILNLLSSATSLSLPREALISAIICVIQSVIAIYETGDQLLTFELMMNPNSQPVERRLSIYFVCDVVTRTCALSAVTFALSWSDAHITWLPYLVIYVNRVWLMALLFVSRGFVYPPEPPATKDDLAVWKKILFAIFPAGFVQFFTDFPFNGDLASNPKFFVVHQVISLGESALCVGVAAAYDLSSLLAAPWPAELLFGIWIVAAAMKAVTFVSYYRARLIVAVADAETEESIAHHGSHRMKSGSQDEVKAMVQVSAHLKALQKDAVLIYIKSTCPECDKALAVLRGERPEAFPSETLVVNIDELDKSEKETLFSTLIETSQCDALDLPIIFIGGKFFGGVPELQEACKIRRQSVD